MSWTRANNGLGSSYVRSFAVSGTDLFAATNDGVFSSPNDGFCWTRYNDGLFNRDMKVLTVVGTDLFSGTAGAGIWMRPLSDFSTICGDADGNQLVEISDIVFLVAYVFGGGPAPNPLSSGDADCNQVVDITDAIYLVNYVFGGGPRPCNACE